MNVMGIDPGRDGGIAVLGDGVLKYWPMKIVTEFETTWRKLGSEYDVKHVFIEKAQSMPKNGAIQMFNYGVGFGKILGWMESMQYPYTLVPPAVWAREMHAGCMGESTKDKSFQAVERLFPGNLWVLPGCKKKHDGMAEAVLIAEFGRRKLR